MAATDTDVQQASAATVNGAQDTGWSQATERRVELYTLLAALFRQPPDDVLLATLAALELPASSVDEDPELTVAWRAVRDSARIAKRAAVDDEFHQLFIGVGRGEILPYASWYLSGFLMDRPLVALRSDLARLGIARNEGNQEPEDHVAALCETMVLLADPAQGAGRAEQRNFFLMHMAPWMGRLFADIAATDSAVFYRAVAALGTAFIDVEKAWLSLP